MPTYAYKCRDCGTPLEVHQEFSDAPLTVCPACGGVLRKQYGSVGVTFNGSGFYRTDSRATGKSESGKSETGTADSGSSTTTSDTGAKPSTDAAKPAPKPAAAPAS
jgi:putative FmdB family regulatory protein